MNERVKKYLIDIQVAIKNTESFCSDVPDFPGYEADLKTKSAVERQLSIIGEAMNKILAVQPDIPLSDARNIINFRNRAVHAYNSIDDFVVWTIVKTHIPVLKTEVDRILVDL